MMKHGENLVEMMGDEIDRIEMNLSVCITHRSRLEFKVFFNVLTTNYFDRFMWLWSHDNIRSIFQRRKATHDRESFCFQIARSNANFSNFLFFSFTEKIPKSSSHRLGIRVNLCGVQNYIQKEFCLYVLTFLDDLHLIV